MKEKAPKTEKEQRRQIKKEVGTQKPLPLNFAVFALFTAFCFGRLSLQLSRQTLNLLYFLKRFTHLKTSA